MAETRDHERARELAASAIDFELEPDESAWLAAHFAGCPACRRWSLMYQADSRALARLPDLATPERVRTRVFDEVAGRRPPGRVPMLTLAGAAAAAVAIAALILFRGIDADLSGPGASTSPSASSLAPPSPSPTPSLTASPSASPPPSPSPTATADSGTIRLRWRTATLPSRNDAAEVRGLSIGEGRALASLRRPDESPALWWTGDGRRWRDAEVASGTFGGASPYLFVPYGNGFLAFGWADRSVSDTERRIWISPDGLAWRPALHRSARLGSLTFGMMTAGGETIVVGGRSGSATLMWTSTDGTHWTSQPVTETFQGAELEGLASDGTMFYTFGTLAGEGVVWRSTDGAIWDPLPGPPNSARILGLNASRLGIVAYGSTVRGPSVADGVWWSGDGSSWTTVSMTPLPSAPGDRIIRIAPTSDGLLAVWQVGGQPGVRMARSADARSWQFLDVRGFPAGVEIVKVEQIDSTIVAVGYQEGQVVAFYAQAP